MNLITWNVQWFRGVDGVVDVARLVREARALADFDLLCLQEVAVDWRALPGGGADDQVARLRALLPGYEVCFGATLDLRADDGTRQRFGNVIASRLPVLQLQHYALPYPAEPGVPSMPRLAVCATVRAPWGAALRVMTTHLEFYAQGMRDAQVRELRRLQAQAAALAARPPAPGEPGSPFQACDHSADCIVTGDFNCDPASAEYRLMLQPIAGAPAFVDAWSQRHGAATPQSPTFRVHDTTYGETPIACDFVFVSDTLAGRVRDVVVDGRTQASDHQPVWLRLDD